MVNNFLVAGFTLTTVIFATPALVVGQDIGHDGAAPRTLDGQPDIQGIYTFRTITPLQRPEELKGKERLTAEEATIFEASENKRLNRDLFDPIKGAPSAGYQPRSEGGVLSYNEFWYERGVELTQDKRTSLIVSPEDGRVPLTDKARMTRAERRKKSRDGFADSHTDRSLADRCIMGFNAGPPMVSGAYNNNVQIFQVPGYVVILNEMVHNTRIIPTDGRPHGDLRQWSGDSRGHWEGDTLVVETINFLRETSFRSGVTTEDLRLIERFTRVSDGTLMYDVTIEDPNAWDRPWSYRIPMQQNPMPLFEYACHEGNYGLTNILAGAREKEAAMEETSGR